MTKLEDTGQKQAAWRTDPKLAGLSNCVGDIGSHIEFMAAYMTGLEIDALCARLDRFGPGRPLDDNATIMVNYKGGAKGVYWSSQIAAGHDNALRLRIYGTKGAVEWFQETPNTARVSFLDRPSGTISRGRDPMWPRGQSLSRLPSGHPEGYFESFANVYSTFITALGKKLRGEPLAGRRPRLSQRRRRRPRRPLYREVRRELGQGRDLAEDATCTVIRRRSMARPVTLFTGQWADLPFEEVCKKASAWGYDGLEIACWGDHMDVRKAAADPAYVGKKKRLLEKYGLKCWALGAHLAGQCVGDEYDPRLDGFAPDAVKGKPEALRKWAVDEMKATARAARAMGCYIVNGFMGSPIWKAWYSFPPTTEEMVEAGFQKILALWTPIFDAFDEQNVKFALEVHPTEIAFDLYTTAAPARRPSSAA